jgi:ferredoxin
MLGLPVSAGLGDRIFSQLTRTCQVFGPVTGSDGVVRLTPLGAWPALQESGLPRVPLKKYLLPPKDLLWEEQDGTVQPPPVSAPVAVLGVAPCDLAAVAYLDQVFAEDLLYRRRRDTLFLAGQACVPGPDCFCPPWSVPPAFDLFLAPGQIWAGSARGAELLRQVTAREVLQDLPEPEGLGPATGPPVPKNLENLLRTGRDRPLWQEVGRRCLSCGACSVVCPTCYCYDVVDTVAAAGRASRTREWDNCFFQSHALVAGGHNFRPDRGSRLRFRLEHKFLGFGSLRGQSSCVGCGRCKKACPVGIDVSEVLSSLLGAEES